MFDQREVGAFVPNHPWLGRVKHLFSSCLRQAYGTVEPRASLQSAGTGTAVRMGTMDCGGTSLYALGCDGDTVPFLQELLEQLSVDHQGP